ncbi:MAG: hypothetical protein M3261_08090 [Thermoproteota archaeon]|nr:hypothetical protein [Thermoproteota archaeon]
MSSNNNTGKRSEGDSSSSVASIVTKTFRMDPNSGNLSKMDSEISDFITQNHRHPDTEFQLTSALADNLYVVTVVIRSPQAKEAPEQAAAGLA